ncbi:MAG: hypothetical protein EOP11_03730 [Proteobacteria bacterium]|nr:MAG: hypothetical protein EOP11_03730 [Pseudomonadota bacterium]
MALVSPLKQDIDKAARDMEMLQRLYTIYFAGGEDDPPKPQRAAFEQLMAKVKSQAAISSNTTDKFAANTLVNRYQVLKVRWDKTMRDIETGVIPKPKKRK